jgi:NAD(P)H-flavin reductase
LHELEKWRRRFDFEVQVTVDRSTTEHSWHGQVGVVPAFIPRANFDPANTTALVCGPEIMMRFTVPELQKRGLALDKIYLSMERNMKCGLGWCGHCQWGPTFICRDGPIYRYDQIENWFSKREV